LFFAHIKNSNSIDDNSNEKYSDPEYFDALIVIFAHFNLSHQHNNAKYLGVDYFAA
jgi:hypothetical protein